MSSDISTVDERWIYIGRCVTVKGKEGHQFLPITPDASPTRALVYAEKTARVVGGIYVVAVTREGEMVRAALSGARYDGKVDADDPRLPRWVADDRAALAELNAESAERAAKREASDDLGRMTLTEARQFINGGAYGQQAARLSVVLKALGVAV